MVQFQHGFYDLLERVGFNRSIFALIGDALRSMFDHTSRMKCKGSCSEMVDELSKPWD
jgi:hypothetical protein